MSEPWSHCPMCTSSQTVWVAAENRFGCGDCCHEWTEEYNHYDREPEINSDR